MKEKSYYDQIITGLDYSNAAFCGMEFEFCICKNCSFSNSDLSQNTFMDCRFQNCNMSTVNLKNTHLKNVVFNACKLTGVDFGNCNNFLFSVTFEQCRLDYSVFDRNALRNSRFADCRIHEASFVESDLSGAVFHHSDLLYTVFSRNNLQGADFRTADNYSIDPVGNRIEHAKFSYPGVLGLLDTYDIMVE